MLPLKRFPQLRHAFAPELRGKRACSRVHGKLEGFVLVAVLLLLGLATLLVVTSTMMARVERKAASNTAKIEQARANALFALDVALNQLQREAGPDQRVTARAEILDTSGTTLNTATIKQPLWTGVWKSGANGLDLVNSGTAQRQISFGSTTPTIANKISSAAWLVSGSATLDPSSFTGVTSGTNANAVLIAKNLGTNAVGVTVPLVPMRSGTATTGTSGAYAYWVSDEGVKAKVNINDPTLKGAPAPVNATADLPKNLLHFAGPQAAAAHKGSAYFGTTDLRASTDLPKITTLQSLANLATLSGTKGAEITPDFTTYGFGVLADVRNGGLKRDLTAAFEDSGATTNKNYYLLNPSGTARVYQARSTTNSDTIPAVVATSLQGLDGLRWINLYYHYNLYKSAAPSVNMFGRTLNSGTIPAGVGNPSAGNRPYSVAPRAIGWTDPDVPAGASNGNVISYGALYPSFLGLRWDVAFNTAETTAGSGQYKLYLRYYPQLVLYNPYSVKIYSSANKFRFGRAFSPVGNLYLQITVGAQNYHVALNLGATQQRMFYNTNFDDTQALEPGEIRVYGFNTQLLDDLKLISGDTNGAACEFKLSASPYGLVSQGFNANVNCKYAEIKYISTCATNATTGAREPWNDTYTALPTIPSNTTVTLRLVANVDQTNLGTSLSNANVNFGGSGSADVSVPKFVFWPTDGGSGGAMIPQVGSDANSAGKRLMIAQTPGVASTGSSVASTTRPDLSAQVDALTGKTQVLSFFIRKKGIAPTGSTSFNNSSLAVPWFSGNSLLFNLAYDQFGARWWDELYIGDLYSWPSYPASSASQIQTALTAQGYTTTSWGNASVGASPPDGSRIVLFDVPVQPMVSLGQFMHLQPFYGMFNTLSSYNATGFGTMFTGGSLPSPEVPLNQTVKDVGGTLGMDHSFLANQALFDSYFFSTVPPQTLSASTANYPAAWSAFNAANTGDKLTDPSKPLINSRMKPYFKNQNAPALADLRDMEKAAANLTLDGAFNINSTSVAAWKAFLGGFSGNDLDIWDASAGASKILEAAGLLTPFVRFSAANSNGSVNNLWSGIRALSDTELNDLASKIVAEVKIRGPFLSLADFLNRRLGAAASSLTCAGALQAAIDKTSLNSTAKSAGVDVSVPTTGSNLSPVPPIAANMVDANGAKWKTTIGAPGYFMQQDIVQAIAPAITARSDTFVVRTYGEARNPRTGEAEARTWAEAVVQRLPDLVDDTQSAETTLAAMNSTNQKFGRRFRVVSFRWLTPNEI